MHRNNFNHSNITCILTTNIINFTLIQTKRFSANHIVNCVKGDNCKSFNKNMHIFPCPLPVLVLSAVRYCGKHATSTFVILYLHLNWICPLLSNSLHCSWNWLQYLDQQSADQTGGTADW